MAEALRRRGIDALTAVEAVLLGRPDEEVLARSLASRRVVVSRDSDFLRLHHVQHPHAGVVGCEQGTRTIGQLVAGLVFIYEVLRSNEMVGRLEFL